MFVLCAAAGIFLPLAPAVAGPSGDPPKADQAAGLPELGQLGSGPGRRTTIKDWREQRSWGVRHRREVIPEPLDEAQIEIVSTSELQGHLLKLAKARSRTRSGRDEPLKARLKREFHMILDRLVERMR